MNNVEAAVGLSTFIWGLGMFASGFYATGDDEHFILKCLQYISPFYLGFKINAINEYADLDLDCDCPPEELDCCDMLKLLGFDGAELWKPFVQLICIFIGFILIAIVLLIVSLKKYI